MNALDMTPAEPEAAPPKDGYGAGYLVYQLASNFHALCCLVGLEAAQAEMAEIILEQRKGKRQ